MKNAYDKITQLLDNNESTGLSVYHQYTENASHGNNAYYSLPKALKEWNEYIMNK